MTWMDPSGSDLPAADHRKKAGAPAIGAGSPLVIGLVNNTSDRALKSTERHFLGLLRAASAMGDLHLRLFTCPEVPRATRPQGSTGDLYDDVDRLFDARLDGLIVTGMEPRAKNLEDEPVYGAITRIADWAQEQAVPVIWSCLAAHAAVLHLDGIARVVQPEKVFGLFGCQLAMPQHRLATDLPAVWATPHSRIHGLPEAPLAKAGYQILSRSDEVGVDVLLRNRGAPFMFLQGHPEYDSDTLLLEYRRDVRRYLLGGQADYPTVPTNYFDPRTVAALERIGQQTRDGAHDLASLDAVFKIVAGLVMPCSWKLAAVRLFVNWLNHVVRDNERSGRPKHFVNFQQAAR